MTAEEITLANFNSLKHSFKNENSESFSKRASDFFENLNNPLEFFCLQIKNDRSLYQTKLNCFSSQFLLELDKFATHNKNKIDKFLTPSLQLSGFEIFRQIKLSKLQSAIVNCFSLNSAPHLILPPLMLELQKENKITTVCSMVMKLNFQSQFTIHEIVIPLFLQDKIGVVEKCLDSNPQMQVEFLKILDGIVGGEIEISDLLYSCNIKGVKGQKSLKVIYKLGMRLMKKYGLSGTCPYILQRHKLSSLRYLFQKHYLMNELSLDSLLLFCYEICNNSLYLKEQTLDLFVEYVDYLSALNFIKDQDIPEEHIPYQIKIFMEDDSKIREAKKLRDAKQQQYKEKHLQNFYSFSLPAESIYVINTVAQFDNALYEINKYTVIAVDTEWKPTLQFDKEEELMLLQIAVYDGVYLFDMLPLHNLLTSDHWHKLGEIFSNSAITKLTYAFSGDQKCLGEFNPKLQEHMKTISNVIDLNEKKKILCSSCPNIFRSLNNGLNEYSYKGLSEMVYLCFGKPLDKMEQCSYWSQRPLSENQILYAALDAFCLLDIYHYLNTRSKELNIDWKSLVLNSSQEKPPQNKITLKNKGNKNKRTMNNYPMKAHSKKICASAFKVVCDSMLQGLGRRLRSCNIDTIILGSSDYHEQCIEIFEKESRVILTRGNVYHRMRKYVPHTHILSIRNDKVEDQLREVTRRFQVIIEDEDLFARCCECNGNRFLSVHPRLISQTKSWRGKRSGAPSWVLLNDGQSRIEVQEGVTHKGVKLRIEEVPYGVLNRIDCVYVCDVCGKCYWDGTHLDRLRTNLGHLVSPKRTQNQEH